MINILKAAAALLLAALIAAPSTVLASDTEGFRFLFPPSDAFTYVDKKIADGYYLVCVGDGDADGAMNVCDENGNLMSETNFDSVAMILGQKLYVFLKNNNLAIIDLTTRAAKKFDFSTAGNVGSVYQNDNTIPIWKNGMSGIAALDGNIIIPPTVYYAVYRIEGTDYYCVDKAGDDANPFLNGVIDRAGNIVIPVVYKSISVSAPGEAIVENARGELGVLSTVTGETIIPFAARDFTINTDIYENMYERYAEVINGKLYQRIERSGKVGLMDNRFNIVVPTMYDRLSIRGNGVVVAQKDGKYGVFTIWGDQIFPFDYNDIATLTYNEPIGQGGTEMSHILSDLFAVKKGDLYALYNIDHTELLPPEFKDMWANGYSRLIYLTNAEGKQGLAEFDGRLLTPKFYDSIVYYYANSNYLADDGRSFPIYYDYPDDMYLAGDSGSFSIYKRDGELAYQIQGKYKAISTLDIHTKRAVVMAADKSGGQYDEMGLVGFDGQMIIPAIYTNMHETSLVSYPHVLGLDVSVAKKDGKWGALDSKGHVVIPFVLDQKFMTAEDNNSYEVFPKLTYESGTGRLTGIAYDGADNPGEFVVHSFESPVYYGSYLGKGAILIPN